ncbi:hypothetical protein K439DRAFT_666004 [Ramaria rubella]|nr:hypothetical protein K439DRAFT_666004 [Ramaria rubella]
MCAFVQLIYVKSATFLAPGVLCDHTPWVYSKSSIIIFSSAAASKNAETSLQLSHFNIAWHTANPRRSRNRRDRHCLKPWEMR